MSLGMDPEEMTRITRESMSPRRVFGRAVMVACIVAGVIGALWLMIGAPGLHR